MSQFPAALFGGPQDGKVFVLISDDRVIKLAVLVDHPRLTEAEPDETSPTTPVKTEVVEYLRTNEYSNNGRIYRYVSNGTK